MTTRLALFNPEPTATRSDRTPTPGRGGRESEEDDVPATDGLAPGRVWSAAVRERLHMRFGEFADLLLDLHGRITSAEVARQTALERWQVWRLIPHDLDKIRWAWLAECVLDALARDDGIILDARTARVVRPASGFAVCVRRTNERLEATEAYLRKHRRRLLSEGQPRYYFGGWENQSADVYEFDLTLVVQDEAEAMAVAIVQGQSAVYDFGLRRSVPVARAGRRAA